MAAEIRWYAVHTHPHSEVKALGHLERQGYRVYLPRYAKVRRHARRTERVVRPLFPRYLFVGLDLGAERWRSIRSTVGVIDIVSFGGQPAPIPSGIVENLRSREDEGGCIRLESHRRLKPGDAVQILAGPFAHKLGLYEEVADSERVAILLDLLGRKVRIMIDAESIEKAV